MPAVKEPLALLIRTTALVLLIFVTALMAQQGEPQTARDPTPQSQIASTSGKPAFEVVSIKPSSSNEGTFLRRQPGGLYRAANVTARALMATAYMAEFPPKGERIIGGPSWIDTEHFDIEAKAAGDPSRDEENLMLQSMLEDRFKLATHGETRRLPIYALVVSKAGKLGPSLVPHSDDAQCTEPVPGKPMAQPAPGAAMPAYCGGFFMRPGNGDLRESGNRITMDLVAQSVNQFVDRPVVNRTGLSGTFDFTLEFAPDLGLGGRGQIPNTESAPDPSANPGIFTALQEQLGLKLEPQTGPMDVLVIDHVEAPTPN